MNIQQGVLVAVISAIAIAGSTVTVWAQRSNNDSLDQIVGKDQQEALGFSKLAADERVKVAALLRRLVQSDAINASARAYLENEGWESVTVLGTRRLKLNEFDMFASDYLIVRSGFSTWATKDSVLFAGIPGEYLARASVFSGPDEIIDHSGSTHSFMFANWEQID